jgi:hypothetical protein
MARRSQARCTIRSAEKKDEQDEKNDRTKTEEEPDDSALSPELLIGFAPGLVPMTLQPGQANS